MLKLIKANFKEKAMKSFEIPEYLHDISKPVGIYFGVLASPKSIIEIRQWCQQLGIDMKNSSSPYEDRIHATVFCANEHQGKSLNDFQEHVDVTKLFIARPASWTLIKSPNTSKLCLALNLYCPELENYHKHLEKQTCLSHAFEQYEPHITIHYNYEGELPLILPNLTIELTEMYHKPYFSKCHNHSFNNDSLKLLKSKKIKM